QKIPQEALQLLDVVCQCCEEVQNLLKEFADFRHSNKITQKIIAINTLEEEADSLYISSYWIYIEEADSLYISNMRKLHTEGNDVLYIIAWTDIFNYFEKCADACEHVA